jgi:sulfur-carrier protein
MSVFLGKNVFGKGFWERRPNSPSAQEVSSIAHRQGWKPPHMPRYIHERTPVREGEMANVPHTVSVEMRFFARYAELLQCETVTLELPTGATVHDAILSARQTLSEGGLLPESPVAAVNRRHVQGSHVLAHGDEVAVFPPLAGG